MTSVSSLPLPAELLTVEEFANRLHLSRATVFAWMQKGILVQGRHFLKYGRVLRFVWAVELINDLLNGSARDEAESLPVRVPKQAKSGPINWDY